MVDLNGTKLAGAQSAKLAIDRCLQPEPLPTHPSRTASRNPDVARDTHKKKMSYRSFVLRMLRASSAIAQTVGP